MLKGKIAGLRAIEKKDLPQLLEWRNRPDFRKFFREYRELGMESQMKWFENVVLEDEHTRMFSIVDIFTGRLLGACGLCGIDWISRSADFSIYIGADGSYIDDDYAVDAGMLMIDYGFRELNLHRLWAEIYDIDEKKKKLFVRLGFIHEATHVSAHWTEGKWTDSLYYRLLEDENRYGEFVTGG